MSSIPCAPALSTSVVLQNPALNDANQVAIARAGGIDVTAHASRLCAEMAGDVNLFFLSGDAEGQAEVMVMIAEPSKRRLGLAQEAVRLMMLFGAWTDIAAQSPAPAARVRPAFPPCPLLLLS